MILSAVKAAWMVAIEGTLAGMPDVFRSLDSAGIVRSLQRRREDLAIVALRLACPAAAAHNTPTLLFANILRRILVTRHGRGVLALRKLLDDLFLALNVLKSVEQVAVEERMST